MNGGVKVGKLQEEILGISGWPSDIGVALRRTPKEIVSLVKEMEDFLIDRPLNLSFSSSEYNLMTKLIGCFASLEEPCPTMPITGLFHVAIKTNDLAVTCAFYERVLGLKQAHRPDFGFPGAWLAVPTPTWLCAQFKNHVPVLSVSKEVPLKARKRSRIMLYRA